MGEVSEGSSVYEESDDGSCCSADFITASDSKNYFDEPSEIGKSNQLKSEEPKSMLTSPTTSGRFAWSQCKWREGKVKNVETKTRLRFADVVPVPVNVCGAEGVCHLEIHSNVARDLGRLRALLLKNETSERALSLTTRVIGHNAADYTAWTYRRRCLSNRPMTGAELRAELKYVRRFTRDHPKNYQVWFHRRWIVEKCGNHCNGNPEDRIELSQKVEWNASAELKQLNVCLSRDPKNMNIWAFRQWLVKRFQLEEDEWNFVNAMIKQDCRNYSAWSYRHFLIAEFGIPVSVATRQREIQFALSEISATPFNEACWNYLKCFFVCPIEQMLNGRRRPLSPMEDLWSSADPQVVAVIDEVLENHPSCRFAVEAKMRHALASGNLEGFYENLLCLKNTVDPIRALYWDSVFNFAKKVL